MVMTMSMIKMMMVMVMMVMMVMMLMMVIMMGSTDISTWGHLSWASLTQSWSGLQPARRSRFRMLTCKGNYQQGRILMVTLCSHHQHISPKPPHSGTS